MTNYSHRQSKLQERRTARDVGGRVQPASGATPFAKGDVRKMGDIRIECKTTSGQSYVLKKSDLVKIRREAASALEEWAFVIQFQKQSGIGRKLVVCDYRTLYDRWAQTTSKKEQDGLKTPLSSTPKKHMTIYPAYVLSLLDITGAFAMQLIFRESDGESLYGLTTWETFQELREKDHA